MNPFGTRQIDVVTFSQFLELTDTEMYVEVLSFGSL